jgi:DNA-binding IclR family transcriptional regulator
MEGDLSSVNVRSVQRACAILELLDGSRRGLNVSEMSRRLSIPKSTVHIIVLTLGRLGYVQKAQNTHRYTLGLKVYGLGQGIMRSLILPDRALLHMKALAEKTGLTVHLAILDQGQAMYVQKADGPGLVRFDTYVGKRTNLHCTAVGKTLLAYAPPEVIERTLAKRSFARHTRNTITSSAALRRELALVRQQQYALDDEEEELAVRCVAVPLLDQNNECVAAMSLSGTVGQIDPESLKGLLSALRRTARDICVTD